MIAKFYPTMQEHVRRIRNKETHTHYLGPQIQNELISLMATNVKNSIVNDTKRAKLFVCASWLHIGYEPSGANVADSLFCQYDIIKSEYKRTFH